MWLRSGTAVAVVEAGSCSCDSTPSLGTSICHIGNPKKKKKKKKKRKERKKSWQSGEEKDSCPETSSKESADHDDF